jgi:hypothetical protein
MKDRFMFYASALVLILAFGMIFYISYLAIYPLRAMEARTQPYKVINRDLTYGDTLFYEVDVCKHVDVPANVARTLRGEDQFISLPPITTNLPKGCSTSISASTVIPDEVPEGTYYLELALSYEVNPFHTIVEVVRTEDFTITAHRGDTPQEGGL